MGEDTFIFVAGVFVSGLVLWGLALTTIEFRRNAPPVESDKEPGGGRYANHKPKRNRQIERNAVKDVS